MYEFELVSKLIEKKFKISAAESCTGGLFGSTIISVPNASKVLDMSFITYSNESKTKLCEVNEKTIEKYGVVSEEVASEMASGVCHVSGANVGVGITGLAGPSGLPGLPVGTICFGFCIDGKIFALTHHFSGERNEIRKKAVDFAMQTLVNSL